MLPLHQRSAKAKRKASDTSYLQSNVGNVMGGVSSPINNNVHGDASPRSGQFSLDVFMDFMSSSYEHKKSSAHKKSSHLRKFQVDIPSRLLMILAMVFLIVPILIFMHKVAHIHEDHDEAHFKAENLLNVDTNAVLSQFRVNNNSSTPSHDDVNNSTGHFVETRGDEKETMDGVETMEQVDLLMGEDKPNAVEGDDSESTTTGVTASSTAYTSDNQTALMTVAAHSGEDEHSNSINGTALKEEVEEAVR
ncbi:MAG: hypothetical protein SGARI_000397 [Bacillariaceae sp.]